MAPPRCKGEKKYTRLPTFPLAPDHNWGRELQRTPVRRHLQLVYWGSDNGRTRNAPESSSHVNIEQRTRKVTDCPSEGVGGRQRRSAMRVPQAWAKHHGKVSGRLTDQAYRHDQIQGYDNTLPIFVFCFPTPPSCCAAAGS